LINRTEAELRKNKRNEFCSTEQDYLSNIWHLKVSNIRHLKVVPWKNTRNKFCSTERKRNYGRTSETSFVQPNKTGCRTLDISRCRTFDISRWFDRISGNRTRGHNVR
jgi:hypothetical protein